MSNSKNIISLLKTIILAFLIIGIGYKILAFAGNYFIYDNNIITSLPTDSNDSYVFYSQADNDITLFPWNYNNSSVSFSYYYGDDFAASDIVDSINLYDYLRYYFYRTIPSARVDYINSNNSSLSSIIDYENLEKYITISTVNPDYFFYDNTITIDNYSYRLNFSFNSTGYIYAFQCKEVHSDDDYTNDIMTFGNNCLSNLINLNDSKNLLAVLNDMVYLSGDLKNYFLDITDSININLNYSENAEVFNENDFNTTISIYDSEKKPEDGSEKYTENDSKMYYYSNSIKNSYQIIKTQNEFLVIFTDYNIVLHYDPLLRTFNGFNLSEVY